MDSILEKLRANMASYPSELSAEIRERERFKEQFQAVCTNQPISFSSLDDILSGYLKRRSVVTQRRKMTLQVLLIVLFCAAVNRIFPTLNRNEMLWKQTEMINF